MLTKHMFYQNITEIANTVETARYAKPRKNGLVKEIPKSVVKTRQRQKCYA